MGEGSANPPLYSWINKLVKEWNEEHDFDWVDHLDTERNIRGMIEMREIIRKKKLKHFNPLSQKFHLHSSVQVQFQMAMPCEWLEESKQTLVDHIEAKR